jgi:hypothetical protein
VIAAPAVPSPRRWERIDIAPGLEIHVGEEFVPPDTEHARAALLDVIGDHLRRIRKSTRRENKS